MKTALHSGHGGPDKRSATAISSTAPDGSITVSLVGELDHDGVLAMQDEVNRAASIAVGVITLDADAVSFVDSSGLRLILQCQFSADANGTRFVLSRPSDSVVRLLRLTGLDDLIAAPA